MDEKPYLKGLNKLLKFQLDFLFLHETPGFPEKNYQGNYLIYQQIDKAEASNVCCGHGHWESPLTTLANGSKVLNDDSNLIILHNSNQKAST
ncbi:MAG: hypothetical protein MRZ79_01195 [Bacteroidia bacterium]|nr:hypothetical protein [Bacteroidia bacterium]